MRSDRTRKATWAALAASALGLCVGTSPALADGAIVGPLALSNGALGLMSESAAEAAVAASPAYPLVLDRSAGLDFDLGGIETRKLQLQLAQPLSLQSSAQTLSLDDGSNMLGLDATLNAPVTDQFEFTAGMRSALGAAQFQPLGSIQCMNGVLRADSYTASGCRFVTEPIAYTEQRRMDLGARVDLGQATASVNWFNVASGVDPTNVAGGVPGPVNVAPNFLSPNLGNPLLGVTGGDPMQYLNSEASGVDLNFKVGIATTNSGDIQLGLAFSHVLDAEFSGLYGNSEALSWTVAKPFNSTRMNLEWSRGSFSGGVQGFYRDSVDFLNRNSVDSLTTFDVHFTWRTPWNANLTVGASNVLDAGAEVTTSADAPPADPLESVYGRIPYVRYKQDL
jgi:hypothetical protein